MKRPDLRGQFIERLRQPRAALSLYQRNFGKVPGTALAAGLAAQRILDRRTDRRGTHLAPASTDDRACSLAAVASKSLRLLDPIRPCLPVVGRRAAVTVLVPSIVPTASFGGVATALRVGAELARQRTMALRVVCTDTPSRDSDLKGHIEQMAIDAPMDTELINVHLRSLMPLDLRLDDLVVATTWWTAFLAESITRSRTFVYVVQDDESTFYAPGDYSVLAAASYSIVNAVPLVNSSVLLDHLRLTQPQMFDAETAVFEPAIDRVSFHREEGRPDTRTLFFYARPDVPRNLFQVGLQALDLAARDSYFGDDWEFVMAGTADRSVELSGQRVIRGKGKLDLPDYARLARRVDVGLSLMASPHPSYPPLELAACGAEVVTNSFAGKRDLSRYSPNIVTVNPAPSSIAHALRAAHDRAEDPRERVQADVQLPLSWLASLEDPIRALLNTGRF